MNVAHGTASAALWAIAAAGLPAMAAAPHVHGRGQMDVAVAEGLLVIELRAAMHDLVGFERPPRNAEEQAAVARVLDALERPQELFGLPADAKCGVPASRIEPPAGVDAPSTDMPDGTSVAMHADFVATYRWECEDSDRIDQLEVRVLERLTGRFEIEARFVTRDSQGTRSIRRPRAIFELR